MSTNQLSFFDAGTVVRAPRKRAKRTPKATPAPATGPQTELPRLNKQCEAILERLRRGRATNRELSNIACKYTGRISDLRKHGHVIEVVSRDRKSGHTVYELKGQA